MQSLSPSIRRVGLPAAVLAVLFLAALQSTLNSCASISKNSTITTSREATAIWNSYQILPNYHYYIWGPVSQPFYIVGIDDKYRLKTQQWKPVDLTPEMLKNWLNYIEPRVGYDPFPYGSFITGPNGERIGLWYSVQDWQQVGSANLSEDNEVSLTTPPVTDPRERLFFFPLHNDWIEPP